MSRFASAAQKASLYATQDGKCAACGCELEEFEAHHIIRWSHGGPTRHGNLCLVCRKCHKGLHMVKLRKGQQRVMEFIESQMDARQLVCQLPTGYGKTMCIALAYSQLKMRGECNRLFVVVANDTQLQQMIYSVRDCSTRLGCEIGRALPLTKEAMVLRTNKADKLEVVVSTIQMLSAKKSDETDFAMNLLRHGNWMLAADEIHHYGDGMAWGDAVRGLMSHPSCRFTIALSATPFRDGPATIFGSPDVKVRYRDAIKEKAVKQFTKHKYEYSVGVEYANGHKGKAFSRELGDQHEVKRHLRYESGYIQPLLREPAERLLAVRDNFGIPAQMIVRAMSCLHAQHLYDTMRHHCKGLRVDWIGTGDDGRKPHENRAIIERFKPTDRKVMPTLDVLVQVGMAGEGFDSVYVCEIVDFALVTLDGSSNQTKQFYGRGSRVIDGCEELRCNINVGTDHPIANESASLNDWIDSDSSEVLTLNDDDKPSDDAKVWDDWTPSRISPGEWDVKGVDAELLEINVESQEFKAFASTLVATAAEEQGIVLDPKNPVHSELIVKCYIHGRQKTVTKENDAATEVMLRDEIEKKAKAFSRLVTMTVMTDYCKSHPGLSKEERQDVFNQTVGMCKKKIRGHYCRVFGEVKVMVLSELKDYLAAIIEDHNAYVDGARFKWLS